MLGNFDVASAAFKSAAFNWAGEPGMAGRFDRAARSVTGIALRGSSSIARTRASLKLGAGRELP